MAKTLKSKSVEMVSKNIGKHGKLKGHNKKETRMLKGICPHHKFNKKGRLKATITEPNGDKVTCIMCGHTFPTKLFDEKKIKEAVKTLEEANDQAKFMSHACNTGDKSMEFFANAGAILSEYTHIYLKNASVAQKQGKIKDKKKKNHGGSGEFGSWGNRR